MNRRQFLQSGSAFGLLLPVLGHAPYPQWNVYRKRNLFILASRTDAPSYELGKAIAQNLATHLPKSHAHIARTPDMGRIASLLSTEQVEVAVLPREMAALMATGEAPFEPYGAVPLTILWEFGRYVLVAHANMPDHHAYQVTQTLAQHSLDAEIQALTVSAEGGAIAPSEPVEPTAPSLPFAFHPGSLAYLQHRPLPQAHT